MNNIIIYNNYIKNFKFNGFTATDFNLLMALCSRIRNAGINTLKFTFDELRKKSGYTQTSISQFVFDLKRMNKKLIDSTSNLETEDEILMFVLFPTFRIDLKNQELFVCVNEKFSFILNDFTKKFTPSELERFIKLESKHAKNLYRLLKQYESTGRFEVSLCDFREKMDCPKSYKNKHIYG